MITLFGKPEPTLLERLKDSVSKTRSQLAARVEELLSGERCIDPAVLAGLENALLAADKTPTTADVAQALGLRASRAIAQGLLDRKSLIQTLTSQLSEEWNT